MRMLFNLIRPLTNAFNILMRGNFSYSMSDNVSDVECLYISKIDDTEAEVSNEYIRIVVM